MDSTNKKTRTEYQKNLRKKRKKTKLRPWAFWLFTSIFVITISLSSYKIYRWLKDNQEISNLNTEIEEIVTPTKNNDEGELINPPEDKESDYWYYTKMPFYDINFEELLQKNNDTVAFIHMDNTNINYPVVQTTDNDYYLTHAFDKSKNDAGWVYMDYRNNKTEFSDNTVIYGHGRLDKTVFGSLKNVLTKEWQNNKENYVIWLSTPTKNMVFQIFSIYTIESESYYITTDFKTEQEKKTWLTTMQERNTTPIETKLTTKDKIITLSTCQNNKGGRIVVHAKLIKQQNKETSN